MPISDLTGYTWVANNNIDITTLSGSYFNITFDCDNDSHLGLEFDFDGDLTYELLYQISDGVIWVYQDNDGATSWVDDAYKTIEITGGTDATNATLIAWLEANGTLTAPAVTPNEYALTHSLTNLTHGNISLTITPDTNYELPSSVTVTNGTLVSYDSTTGIVVISGDDTTAVSVTCEAGVVIDPVLANNSWDVIKQVCQSGDAADYWALGDTKTDTGTDSATRTMRICDMQGLYGKHVVFEQVEQESTTYVWNPSSNTDNDSAYNDYNIADIKTTLNTTIKGYYSSDLQNALTQTTVKVAKNGNSGTILDVTDYLFLPAEKEIFGSVSYSRSEEGAVLTQFSLYQANNTASFRIKQRGGQNKAWWLRSPRSGGADYVCGVSGSGGASYNGAYGGFGVAPCFAF